MILIQKNNNTFALKSCSLQNLPCGIGPRWLSRMISLTCQKSRTDDLMYPIRPIIQVNAVASIMSAYEIEQKFYPTHRTHLLGPFIMTLLSANMKKRQDKVVAT